MGHNILAGLENYLTFHPAATIFPSLQTVFWDEPRSMVTTLTNPQCWITPSSSITVGWFKGVEEMIHKGRRGKMMKEDPKYLLSVLQGDCMSTMATANNLGFAHLQLIIPSFFDFKDIDVPRIDTPVDEVVTVWIRRHLGK